MALKSLSKTLDYYCFILRMGHKAVGLVCFVMHIKKVKEHFEMPVNCRESAHMNCII